MVLVKERSGGRSGGGKVAGRLHGVNERRGTCTVKLPGHKELQVVELDRVKLWKAANAQEAQRLADRESQPQPIQEEQPVQNGNAQKAHRRVDPVEAEPSPQTPEPADALEAAAAVAEEDLWPRFVKASKDLREAEQMLAEATRMRNEAAVTVKALGARLRSMIDNPLQA